jgi:hypothetical protein
MRQLEVQRSTTTMSLKEEKIILRKMEDLKKRKVELVARDELQVRVLPLLLPTSTTTTRHVC